MMAKTDFSQTAKIKRAETGIAAGRVMDSMSRGKTTKGRQGAASPEEQAERAAKMKTQGRKGCKATRINMAIQPDNYDFIRVMSGVSGQSMTDFVNAVIAQYRKENLDVYDQAKAFSASLKSARIED